MVKKRCSLVLTCVGLVITVIGSAMLIIIPIMFHKKIIQRQQLRADSPSYGYWLDPPAPTYMYTYLFDIANPLEVQQQGAKPVLIQRGPYTYRVEQKKVNISHNSAAPTVQYTTPSWYHFEPSLSAGDENDTVTVLNLPIVIAASVLQYRPVLEQEAMAAGFELLGVQLFERHTVRELLWGYTVKSLAQINNLSEKILGKKIVDDRFGLYAKSKGNGSTGGVFSVYTGVEDINRVNQIHTWNGKKTLDYWNTDRCNMINGSDGSLVHPYFKRTEKLQIYNNQMCRSVDLTYTEDTSVHGVTTQRYSLPASQFADSDTNPDNIGFCTPQCLKSGVLNLTRCSQDAPFLLSQPHFYQGSPDYVHAVEGLNPHPDMATAISVEPYTGAPFSVIIQFQINIHLKKYSAFRATENIKDSIFLPVFWFNETSTITSELASKVHRDLIQLMVLLHYLALTLATLGGALVLASTVYMCVYRKKKEPVPLLEHEEPVDYID